MYLDHSASHITSLHTLCPQLPLVMYRRHYTLPTLEWVDPCYQRIIKHLGLPLRETLRVGALRRPAASKHATVSKDSERLPSSVAHHGCPAYI